jgi:predicted amidohydrolase
MARARRRGAQLAHFHEAALSGYLCAKGAPPLKQYDWPALREGMDRVRAEAARLNLWVVIGSAHPLTPPHKPTNCLYLIDPDGKVRDRYDKRFCTNGDLKAYSPGDHFVTFDVSGVRCGLLICYDVRFPDLYRRLYQMGVRAVFQSFNNAAMKPGPNIHTRIMRQTVQAYAGIYHVYVSATNTNRWYSSWPGAFITPDGLIAASLRQNVAGLMVNEIDLSKSIYDASRPFRDRALRGILHSGTVVEDPRRNRRSAP